MERKANGNTGIPADIVESVVTKHPVGDQMPWTDREMDVIAHAVRESRFGDIDDGFEESRKLADGYTSKQPWIIKMAD